MSNREWKKVKIGSFAREVSERAPEGAEVLSVTKYAGFVPSLEYFGKQVFSKDTSNYKLVRRGQFAYATIHLDEGSIDCLNIRDEGVISPMYTVFEVDSNQVDRRFLIEALRSPMLLLRYAAIGAGTVNRRKSIGFDGLAAETLDLPPLPEQKKIAAILSSVDEAIQATQAVIEQTRRVKEGLLQDLLTRGIGHTRFKQTEIGQIPAGWRVIHLEDACSHIVDCPHSTPEYVETGVPCVRTADLLRGRLLIDQAYRVSESTYQDRIGRLRPEAGDIIYSREGERFGIAAPVGEERVCLGQRVMHLRAAQNILDGFLLAVMNSNLVYQQAMNCVGSTTSPHINIRDIRRFRIPQPELDEQTRIAAAFSALDRTATPCIAAMDSLVRTKSSLLTTLLTGQTRVTP